MSKYINSLNPEIKEYFNILCNSDYPKFIDKYIDLPNMQRLSKIGQFCGCDYTNIFNIKYWYSRLDHSISCALMTWNFTKDKKQTLIALFHDLGTPAFSHTIDYLLDDHINQKSSEKNVLDVLNSTNEFDKYFLQDNFEKKYINDIKKYTIVENSKPKLCVDRLDGVLHTGYIWLNKYGLSDVQEIYKNIIVLKNEDLNYELGFKDINSCENFFEWVFKYSMVLQTNEPKYIMQFLADYVKEAIDKKYITVEDLYILGENEVIQIISNMDNLKWNKFSNSKNILGSETKPENVYSISIESKKRYVNPLCLDENNNINRIDSLSKNVKSKLEEFFDFKDKKYAYIEGII